jgi:hypothetical protein
VNAPWSCTCAGHLTPRTAPQHGHLTCTGPVTTITSHQLCGYLHLLLACLGSRPATLCPPLLATRCTRTAEQQRNEAKNGTRNKGCRTSHMHPSTQPQPPRIRVWVGQWQEVGGSSSQFGVSA